MVLESQCVRLSLDRIARGLGRIRCSRGPGMLPCGHQLIEMLIGTARRGFSPLEYQLYGFYRRDRDRSGYVSLRWTERELRARLNSPAEARVLKDKLEFYRFCCEHDLPTPSVLALVGSGDVPDGIARVADGDELAAFLAGLMPGRLIAKPVGAQCGKGVMLIEKRPDGTLVDPVAGRQIFPDALWIRMSEDIRRRQSLEDSRTGYLLQEYVHCAAAMNPAGGHALNTVRIATLVDSGGSVHLDFALLKLARPDAPSDNLHYGGTVAGVDLGTGAIGTSGWCSETPGCPWLRRSSGDPGKLFAERRIPAWDEFVSLAQSCAGALPGVRSVGWDIALAESGPVVIEGNDNQNIVFTQFLDGPYLTPARRAVLAGLGLRLP